MSIEEQLAVAGTVLIAALLGSVVGIERRLQGKSAGIRTHSFIAAATALVTSLSMYLIEYNFSTGTTVSADPTRILHSIIVGVSFIGGGMIFHKSSSDSKDVKNLTTAASILLIAVMGVAVGLGLFVLATAIVALVISINVSLRFIQNKFFPGHEVK